MNKIYQRIDWENYPSSATPLNEDNLNKMDYAIDKLDDRIVTHETTKLNTATGNTLVKNVTFNETTGVFTIEKLSGSKITINTALEKISTNFHFNPTTQKLILTLIDGTTQEIDLSALLTQYEFLESDTITFTIDASGKVKANILNGSITGEKLEPNYLANVTLQAKNAKTSADNAKTSEQLAYQYAEEAKESASQTAKNDAANITYDNATSGLASNNVQGAIDELKETSGEVNICSEVSGKNPTLQDSASAPIISQTVKGFTKQDGTPTPDAPIEIVGMDKVSVKTTGKNIFGGLTFAQALNSASYSSVLDENAKTITFDRQKGTESEILFDKFKENTQYTLIVNGKVTGPTQTTNTCLFMVYDDGGLEIVYFTTTEEDIIVTTKENATVKSLMLGYRTAVEVTLNYEKCGVFEGVVTVDDFAPYTETVAEIDLTEPLYEGDYIEYRADGTGVLHRKMASFVFDGEEDVSSMSFRANDYVAVKPKVEAKKNNINTYSNYYKTVDVYDLNNIPENGILVNHNGDIILKDERYATVTEYKAWLQSNPVTVVYELATPQEIELTAEQLAQFKQLRTFEPITNVLCDGETVTQYYKNTPSGVAVSKIHSRVNELENHPAIIKPYKNIIITDSYGNPVIPNGGGTITPFINRLPALMGWSSNDYKASYQDGAGFGNGLFLSQLKTLRNSMTSAEAEEYTNIVVLGGYNDWQQTFISLKSAMQTFCDYAKTNFPNATVKIGYISGSRRAGDRYNLKIVPLNTYRCASLVGAVYLRNLEYVLHDNCYFLTGNNQYQHPLDIGHELLAPFIAEALKTGGCSVARQHTKYKVTFASGITETVALYITSSQVNDQLTIANEVAFMTFNSNKTINDAEYFNIGTLPSECHIIGSYQSYEGNYPITVAYTDSADNSGVCTASIHFNGRTGDTGNVTVQLCLYTGGKTLTLKSICIYANSGLLSSNEC